jgi:hypothetical protein
MISYYTEGVSISDFGFRIWAVETHNPKSDTPSVFCDIKPIIRNSKNLKIE